jgi:hypothetical protein
MEIYPANVGENVNWFFLEVPQFDTGYQLVRGLTPPRLYSFFLCIKPCKSLYYNWPTI